jgi:outer membrane protein OmpA-like peptidoglycan-associated protein
MAIHAQDAPQLERVEGQGHRERREVRPGDPIGLRRARAVAWFLETVEGSPGRLEVVDHGDMRPADSNRTEAGRAKNRPVSFVVLPVPSRGTRGRPGPSRCPPCRYR